MADVIVKIEVHLSNDPDEIGADAETWAETLPEKFLEFVDSLKPSLGELRVTLSKVS